LSQNSLISISNRSLKLRTIIMPKLPNNNKIKNTKNKVNIHLPS